METRARNYIPDRHLIKAVESLIQTESPDSLPLLLVMDTFRRGMWYGWRQNSVISKPIEFFRRGQGRTTAVFTQLDQDTLQDYVNVHHAYFRSVAEQKAEVGDFTTQIIKEPI